MNNSARAEKIANYLKLEMSEYVFAKDFITSQIDDAVREASLKISAERCKRCEIQGFAKAIDLAAAVAKSRPNGCCEDMAERIRALPLPGETDK